MTPMLITRIARITLAAATAFLCAASNAEAALVFQTDSPVYTIDTAGTTTARVEIFLAQTTGTTLSAGGGVNSIKFIVTPTVSPLAPQLNAIEPNLLFTGNRIANLPAASLYEEMSSISAGVPLSNGRVFLGTFVYNGFAGVRPSTTFTIQDAPSDDGFTATGASFDSELTPGSFTVAVPEPSAALVLVGLAAGLLRRGRSER